MTVESICSGGGQRRRAARANPVRSNGATRVREQALAERQWSSERRCGGGGRRSVCGKESPRPSPVAYKGGGGGEWDPGAAMCPGLAVYTGRPIGRSTQRIPAQKARRATWGPGPAVMSNRAWVVGSSALTAPRKNRKRRAMWVGQSGGQSNRWKAIG